MISIKQALKIHTIAIEKFGGANGVRDMGGLESALARPFQTFLEAKTFILPFLKKLLLLEKV